MENQTSEDKLAVLQNIFGQDLTDSLISRTLTENNNEFDPTVEKLLAQPANKVKQPPPQQPQPQPMDPKALDNIKRLHNMFGDLTQSVITTVYESNKRDVEGTVDTLLNLTSNEVASGQRKEAEIARQEQELKAYEEFKKAQQRLQEEERRQTEVAQQQALQRAKEEEQRRKEEAQKAELERKSKGENAKALQEQERMLLEYQRRKAEEEAKKKAQEETKKKADEEVKKRAEEEVKKRTEEEVKKRTEEEVKKRTEEEVKKRTEEEVKKRTEIQIKEQERQRLEKEIMEKDRIEKEKIEKEKVEKEKAEMLRLKARKLEEEKIEKERAEREEAHKRTEEERRIREERLALERLASENEYLQKHLEMKVKEEMQREEEERKKFVENERRFREEQESVRRAYEEKVKKLESERRAEEKKRLEEETKREEAKRREDEERMRQEADMRRILELERLKLDEQRKRIEEEKKSGEARLRAMEEAALMREEEEAQRLRAEEERKREEEERARLLKEEEEARERIKEEARKAQEQEQFTASAILVPPAGDEPKVEITTTSNGNEISGTWALVSGILPPQAWLGLFPKRAINTNVGYAYITGASGEFNFKPLTPGHYEVRVFSNKPVTSRIAESAPILIGPTVVSFNYQQHQSGQLMLNYTLDPPASPSSRDWVGIYEKGQRRNQNYTTSGYGHTTGMISIQVPRTPGDYEARLFVTGAKYNDQAAIEFTVEDHDRVVGEFRMGVIKASWVMRTVETTSSDWIGLFVTGEASNNKYLASIYTGAASEGSVDIPLPKDTAAGSYELRLFSSKLGKYVTFRTSDIITINL